MDAGRPRQNWPMGMGYPSITWFFLTRQNQRSWEAVHYIFSFVLQLSPQSSTASVLRFSPPTAVSTQPPGHGALLSLTPTHFSLLP